MLSPLSFKNSWEQLFFYKYCVKSWWILLFFTLCFTLYHQATSQRDKKYKVLLELYTQLEQDKARLLIEQKELKLKVASQEDYHWIEQTLIKELGVIPKGYKKVVFSSLKN